MVDNGLKRLFQCVYARLSDRKESLQLFWQHWDGSSVGVEAWLKLEFVAAIPPKVAKIETGGAAGRGRKGKFADLKLTFPGNKPLLIELKAGIGNWWYGGSKAYLNTNYNDHVLAFISFSKYPLPDSQWT